jgi:glycosyltransferase involved in cell wall biosynthesis
VRLLLHLDNLRIGGAQHSTIDLAAALERAGHDVLLAAGSGPLASVVDERGVPRVDLPGGPHPGRAAARAVADVASRFQPDVVLTVGPLAALEAVTGPGLRNGTPIVAAYPSDTLPPAAPRSTAVTGRRRGVLDAARRRNRIVADIPATVDTTYNHPDVCGSAFRAEHGAEGAALVVVVSRLSEEQKGAGIRTAVRAAGVLAARRPVRFVVLGDGSLRPAVEAEAAEHGGGAVAILGEVVDPRPAYAAADVVMGLGTSVLRGMAHARPCIALGGGGEATVVEPPSIPGLVTTGWLATGAPTTPEGLADLVASLLDDPERAAESARSGREAVVAERDGARVVELLTPVLADAVAHPPSRPAVAVDVVRSWTRWWVGLYGGRLYRRVRYRLRMWSGRPVHR